MDKMTLKVKVNYPYFQYQPRVCMVGANLVIPAQICEELLCRQSKVYGQTEGRTDGQAEAMTIPLRLKG